jgi:Uma2 family endonuclease
MRAIAIPIQDIETEPGTTLTVHNITWEQYNAVRMRECLRLDLEIHPPVDLAIESDVTSHTTLEIYQRLQIPELWIYRDGTLKIYLLENGKYVESLISKVLPNFPILTLIPQRVQQAFQQGTSSMLRDLRGQLT